MLTKLATKITRTIKGDTNRHVICQYNPGRDRIMYSISSSNLCVKNIENELKLYSYTAGTKPTVCTLEQLMAFYSTLSIPKKRKRHVPFSTVHP